MLQTLREVPRDADVISQQLMMRAGMIHKLAAGIYAYLPLAWRSIRRFEQIVREELEREGCQELLMPAVQPAELWQQSGRWQVYGTELLRFKDRKNADFCLGPTHEEIVTDVVRSQVRSYRQLPLNLFQIQAKFRDEIRPRFGLMRGREFIMKDGYSFHVDDADADREYWRMFAAYKRIFSRVGVRFRAVEADSGAIGGSFTHEFHVLAQSGEDAVLSCTHCEYTSNAEKTEAPPLPAVDHGPAFALKCDHFATPGIVNMEEQARAFRDAAHDGLPLHQASKFYLLRVTNLEVTRTVGLVLRGDHEPNLVKLRNLLGSDAIELLPLEEAEALACCRSGFIGPVGLSLPMYVDSSLADAVNLTCGANRTDHHHFGFSPRRDLDSPVFADLRMAQAGDACPRCGEGTFEAFRGIEVGQVFKLGTKYSRAMACLFLDEHGHEQPMVMGCYGIGITRTIAAVIEQNHDADGIIWPWPVAPYHVHLLNLDPAHPEVNDTAHRLEEELEAAGFDVLHDDREGLSPGVKFKDADLLGFPLRAMVGSRSLKSGVVELRDRRTKELRKFKPEEMVAEVTAARDRILRDLASSAS